MKRFFLLLTALFGIVNISAQKVIVGDVNGDNKLSVSDVTELVNIIIGKTTENYIYTAEDFIRENALSGKFKINGVVYSYINGELDPYNGYEYVDLGLSVKWATMNIGATSPVEFGNYFAWGEIVSKNSYNWSSYQFYNKENSFSKYSGLDNLGVLELKDDAANIKWKGNWRIPTVQEVCELMDGCYWEFTPNYKGTRVSGYIVYKAKNQSDKGQCSNEFELADLKSSYSLDDIHIFLPFAGYKEDRETFTEGEDCYYWTSSLHETRPQDSYFLYMHSTYTLCINGNRYYGQVIRAVCE